jgi:hypothetical protein
LNDSILTFRGTAFVEYESAESAAICLEEAYRPKVMLAQEHGKGNKSRDWRQKNKKDTKTANRHGTSHAEFKLVWFGLVFLELFCSLFSIRFIR